MDMLTANLYQLLSDNGQSLSTILNHLLLTPYTSLSDQATSLLDDVLTYGPSIAASFCQYPAVHQFIDNQTEKTLIKEIQELISIERGWYFSTLRATSDQVRDVKLEDSRKHSYNSMELDNEDEKYYWDIIDGITPSSTQDSQTHPTGKTDQDTSKRN
ncbi:hypothetical protein C8Q75DRAFT_805591 [Abortiporus biennis]|nr:hypothetical protein C8Q75DRAFT_805591 [Abortiporus biennis]